MTSVHCAECKASDSNRPNYKRSRFETKLAFLKNGTCSRTLLSVINNELNHPMPGEERAADPLAGGLMQGYQCGMLWGAALAAGGESYYRNGPGPKTNAAALHATARLVSLFKAQNSYINCLEITETDPRNKWQVFMNFFIKGGTFVCMRRAADFAPKALAEIHAALDETSSDYKNTFQRCPGNCAALLAKKLGASERHQAMAAGFSGGIGLSGGACGALGAAIWLAGLEGKNAQAKRSALIARTEILVERFLKVTDYEFECKKIVGSAFDSIEAHIDHVRSGGCSDLIAALVENVQKAGMETGMKRPA